MAIKYEDFIYTDAELDFVASANNISHQYALMIYSPSGLYNSRYLREVREWCDTSFGRDGYELVYDNSPTKNVWLLYTKYEQDLTMFAIRWDGVITR